MPRGNNNNNRGRGRGRGGRGRGRGRGGPGKHIPTTSTIASATGPADRAPRNRYPHLNTEFDVAIQQWAEPSPPPGVSGAGNANRRNGLWRARGPKSRSGAGTPLAGLRGTDSGNSTPRGTGGRGRGRGRGRGFGRGNSYGTQRRPRLGVGSGPGAMAKSSVGNGTLSDLLYSDRPLLRPIKFVRATLTPFLFQQSEEVLKPATEVKNLDTTEASHVPTADRVARLFREHVSDSDSDSEGDTQDDLEEIDFADMAEVRAEVDAIALGAEKTNQDIHDAQEEIEEVDFADLATILAKVDAVEPQASSPDIIFEETFTGVYNKTRHVMQPSSITDIVDEQPNDVQQSSASMLDSALSVGTSDHGYIQDNVVVEEEVYSSSNGVSDVPAEEAFQPATLDAVPPSLDELVVSSGAMDTSAKQVLVYTTSAVPCDSVPPDICVEETSLSKTNVPESITTEDISPSLDMPSAFSGVSGMSVEEEALSTRPNVMLESVPTGVTPCPSDVPHSSNRVSDIHGEETCPSTALDETPHSSDAPLASHSVSDVPLEETLLPTTPDIVLESVPSGKTVLSSNAPLSSKEQDMHVEETFQFTAPDAIFEPAPASDLPPNNDHPLFVIDTTPTYPFVVGSPNDVILVDRTGRGETLGDQDEERIVYVAPHPRSGRASPIPAVPRVKLPRASVLTGHSIKASGITSPIREDEMGEMTSPGEATSPTHVTHMTPAARARKREEGPRRKRQRRNNRDRLGLGMSEAMLKAEDKREKHRPRWATRRKDDSDVDWGTEGEDDDVGAMGDKEVDEVDVVSSGLGGMEIDSDLELDVDAMKGFLKSMSVEGSRFVTMDDVEDDARMRQEDEKCQEGLGESSGSELEEDDDDLDEEDEEEEEIFNLEEEFLIAESEGEEQPEFPPESDEDDELSPKSSFQTRLHRIRERSRRQHSEYVREIPEDEDEDVPQYMLHSRSAVDEDYIAHIHDILEEHSDILSARDRKQRKAVFRNLHEGYVDDTEFTTPTNKKQNKKGKGKQYESTDVFADKLQAQWEKDREKKAARKQERMKAQLSAALDPLDSPNGKHSGASRKAMRAAARLDPDAALALAPRAIVDVTSLQAQIRRFAGDVSVSSMALPSMDKAMRKMVHEMAAVFGINSISKGKGRERYTTLFRTSRTGMNVREDRVAKLIKRYGGGKGKGKGARTPRQKEGDEVGKEAPKIGASNIGFKMLASMGWSEGDRIGGMASVGIEAPLTAIIKNSKLGLGATR